MQNLTVAQTGAHILPNFLKRRMVAERGFDCFFWRPEFSERNLYLVHL